MNKIKKHKFGNLFLWLAIGLLGVPQVNEFVSNNEIANASNNVEIISEDNNSKKCNKCSTFDDLSDEPSLGANVRYAPMRASNSAGFEEVKIVDSGMADDQSLVLTFVGDGYTASEQSKYVERITKVTNCFLGLNGEKGIYPFNQFKDFFSVYAIKVISNQSGVSRANFLYNNHEVIDNYFGSSFWQGSDNGYIQRAMAIKNEYTAKSFAKPNSLATIVYCNSQLSGGTAKVGGELVIMSDFGTNTGIAETLAHELGHAYGNLMDEYYYEADGSFIGAEKPNMTTTSDANQIKWHDFLGREDVGIYPCSIDADKSHPYYDPKSEKYFKPSTECRMQDDDDEFCPVCAHTLIEKMSKKLKIYFSSSYYSANSIGIRLLYKYRDIWAFVIENKTGSTNTFYYNAETCNQNDARYWEGNLTKQQSVTLTSGEKVRVYINQKSSCEYVAFSYIAYKNGNPGRKIFYARGLSSTNGSMSVYSSSKSYQDRSYLRYGMQVTILDYIDHTWYFIFKNRTGARQTFDYNYRMCNEGDARNFSGLKHVRSVTLDNNESTSYIFRISENGGARYITLGYMTDATHRKIMYANELNVNRGSMMSTGWIKEYHYYDQHGINVCISYKSGSVWKIYLNNNTGKARKFEYNCKMCNEGDATNFGSGLSDIREISLNKDETQLIEIEENGWVRWITISYLESDTCRRIFYAYELDPDECTLTSFANTVDPTASSSCISENTYITLADGTQKKVKDLKGNEMLLVWNLETGKHDVAPILFIDKDPTTKYEVITLHFSDNTKVEVISEHGFFDTTLNKYVYLDKNAEQYLGHKFIKESNGKMKEVSLKKVKIKDKKVTPYSPVTFGHLCYYVNGMLSMPGGIDGLFNYFEIDKKTMMYDKEKMNADIEHYGLFTYEEFAQILPVPEEIFEAVNGKYLKVAIGKGLITFEKLAYLIDRYSVFF